MDAYAELEDEAFDDFLDETLDEDDDEDSLLQQDVLSSPTPTQSGKGDGEPQVVHAGDESAWGISKPPFRFPDSKLPAPTAKSAASATTAQSSSPRSQRVPSTARLRYQNSSASRGRQEDEIPLAKSLDVLRRGLRSPEGSNIPSPRARAHLNSKATASKLTVPQAPRLHHPRVDKQAINREDPYSMAQAEEVLKKGLRSGSSPESSTGVSKTSPASLTVPKAPQLHQPRVNKQAISREDPYSMAQAEDVLKKALRSTTSEADQITKTSPSRITVPQAPRFHHSHRERDRESQFKQEDVPMAQSIDLLKKGLRNTITVAPAPASPTRTVPRAPVFHAVHERPLPKSREELEDESMEQFTPFKAIPMPNFAPKSSLEPEAQSRPKGSPTKVEPFHFHSDERAAHHKQPEPSVDKELLDLQECKKKFKARPMPQYLRHRHGGDDQSIASTTKSTTSFRQDESIDKVQREALTMRPSCVSPEYQQSTSSFEDSSEPRIVITDDLDATLQETNRQFRSQDILPTDKTSSVSTLEKARLEEYRRRKEEKRRLEQEQERKLREFHARPLPQSIRQELQLRGELYKDRKQSHEPETNGKQFEFRARPLPKAVMEQLQHRGEKNMSRDKDDRKDAHLSSTFHARPLPKFFKQQSTSAQLEQRKRNMEDGMLHDNVGQLAATPQLAIERTGRDDRSNHASRSVLSLTEKFEEIAKMKAEATESLNASSRFDSISKGSGAVPAGADLGPVHLQPEVSAAATKASYPSAFSRPSMILFISLCLFRAINACLIRTYFDPDEFWQTLEPAYCAVFSHGSDCPGLTWEWKRRTSTPFDVYSFGDLVMRSMLGPVRTYLSVLPTYLLYNFGRMTGLDSSWMISLGPSLLHSIIFAATTDWCIWYSARWMQTKDSMPKSSTMARWCLWCSMTSWFNAYSLVRTYSNAQETCFVALAIALVSPELLGNRPSKRPAVRACLAFFIGGLSLSIRFTSIATFVPMGIILADRRKSTLQQLEYLCLCCGLFGLLGIVFAMVVDRFFYGFWTIPFLGNFHFNVVMGNASLYGTHPWHWYFSVGVPAVSGLLFPFLLGDFCGRGSSSYGRRNLWILALSYVVMLSFSAHKEFRFLHPILPMICLLVSPRVGALAAGNSTRGARWLRDSLAFLFVVANLAAAIYLGLFHQAAPLGVNRKILDMANSVHAVNATTNFSVYYWTGACHSTPLHSHLHSPPLQFRTWSLDCSPDCRSDPNILCEADLFVVNPSAFVASALCASEETSLDEPVCDAMIDDKTVFSSAKHSPSSVSCSQARVVPDFVVTHSTFVDAIRHQLEQAGLKETGRFFHAIRGLRLGSRVFGEDGYASSSLRRIDLHSTLEGMFGAQIGKAIRSSSTGDHGDMNQGMITIPDVLEISVDEMILFARV